MPQVTQLLLDRSAHVCNCCNHSSRHCAANSHLVSCSILYALEQDHQCRHPCTLHGTGFPTVHPWPQMCACPVTNKGHCDRISYQHHVVCQAWQVYGLNPK